MLNIVSVRVGSKYGPEYVAILHDMVTRNLSTYEEAVCHWCVTDDPESLPEYVNAIAHDPNLPGWWQKVRLFSEEMPWVAGERVAYFDLDVAIVGRLEDLIERKGIIQDWHWPCYNSSVMVWDHGEHRIVWDQFSVDPQHFVTRASAPTMAALLPSGQVNGGDQEFITEVCAYADDAWDTFPAGWFVSYRNAQGWPPHECKAVIFHGQPKPHEVSGWVANVWKVNGFTSLPKMDGMNVSHEAAYDNVRVNCGRELPWFTGFRAETDRAAVIVCGGPSLKDRLPDIRWHARNRAKIISVNGTLKYLMERGVKPHAHVMLDARPENIDFIKDAPEGVTYYLASQCHPSLFEALADREVVVWHNMIGEPLREVLAPWWDSRPIVLVPGGGTVGLRAVNLAWLSGYKKIHLYGMDGSYGPGGDHHAYPQALNDNDGSIDVMMGEKRYRCAPWMVRQAEEFREAYEFLADRGVRVHAHGEGLVPDIAKQLRDERRAA